MPKEFNRTDRIGEQVQRELARLLQKEMRDPRLSLVTIMRVDVSRDLAHAKVFITQLSVSNDIKETVKTLNRAANHLRYLLAQSLKLRVVPQLRFIHDDTVKRAVDLSQLIDKAVEQDENKK